MVELNHSYSELFLEGMKSEISYSPDPLPLEKSGDISWYLLDLFTGKQNLITGEDSEILSSAGKQIEDSLELLGIPVNQIQKIGAYSQWYIIVHLKDGGEYIFNLKHLEKNFSIDSQSPLSEGLTQEEPEKGKKGECHKIVEGTNLEQIFRENTERYNLAWGNFQDHLNAMDAIFDANAQEGIFSGNGFLDNEDKFDANSIMRIRIVNPDLLKEFDTLSLSEIQQKTRMQYRALVALMGEYPLDMLPPTTQYAISKSIDTYTRMIMGIGDKYEGGARHFEKSKSEVDYGIFFSVEYLQSPQEVMQHWLEVRKSIDANNFQDTTIEQRAYPYYIQTFNRACYQKMLDTGASKEELLAFARAISGRDTVTGASEWTYGPDHYDAEFANIILGNLIGLPQKISSKKDNNQESEEKDAKKGNGASTLEKLMTHNIIQSIIDPAVTSPENLDGVIQKTKNIFQKANLDFPSYMNTGFFAGESGEKILQGKYTDLTLEQKIAVSSLSRFLNSLETSLGNYENPQKYKDSLKKNAQSISDTFTKQSIGNIGIESHSLRYDQDLNTYIVGVNPFGGGMIYVQIPLEKIQSIDTAYYYIQSLSQIVIQNGYIPSDTSGIYASKKNNGESINWENLISQVPNYSYGSKSDDVIPAFGSQNLPEGYIENLRNRSISESFDYITDTIVTQFDDRNWLDFENNFIDPQNLNPALFSKTERNILELWTNINGLGEWHEWSDANVENAMTGLKIGLIIALSIAATTLTAGVAAGGLTLAGARGIQVAGAIQRTNFLRYSIQSTQILNATRGGSMIYGGIIGAYAAPVSWVVYPHGYSTKEEMIVDVLSDLSVSTGTGVIGGGFTPGILSTITDFTVLGLMTEAVRMGVIQEIYHPGENFLDDTEITMMQ